MTTQPDTLTTVVAYQQATARLRDGLTRLIEGLWRSLGVYRNEQMASFAAQIVPLVVGAQQQMASLTAAYLAAQRAAALNVAFAPLPVNPASVTGGSARNGADMTDVYSRPFHLVWRRLHDGTPVDEAIQSGLDRAVQTGLTDLQLAKTRTSQQVLTADRHAVGYRRVLEGPHSCGLCVIASTQRYHKRQLMPIHPACDCGVATIYGDSDPGNVIDVSLLESAHQAIEATFGVSDRGGRTPDYRTLLVTHDHGELGPVLARKGAPFLGPSGVGK